MGLHISSIASLPLSETRDYYLYVLDYYNWNEPISKTLTDNIDRIQAFCAANDAVMVKGLPDSHFSSEVLSWVGINGEHAPSALPALMVTTVHPTYFMSAHERKPDSEIEDALVLLKIRELCPTSQDVVTLLEKIFSDIKQKKRICDFAVSKEQRAGDHPALVDALILEPNVSGIGVDLRKLGSWLKAKARTRQKLP